MRKYSFGVGSASLLLIFSTLCLTVFTLLTLSTVNRERALTEKHRAAVERYYAADGAAVEIAADLLGMAGGEIPAEVGGIPVYSAGDGVYSYRCPIDERRALSIRLQLADGEKSILTWSVTGITDWIPDESLNVWKGE